MGEISNGNWINRYALYFQLLNDSTSSWMSDPLLAEFMSLMQGTSAGKLAEVEHLKQSDSTAAAAAINATVQTDTLLPPINQRTVNELLLNYYGQGIELNSSQLLILMSIALQCPFTGGSGVYDARSLWYAIRPLDSIFFNDDEACNQALRIGGASEMLAEIIFEPIHLEVYPNPANNAVTIYYAFKEFAAGGKITVSDYLGRQIYSKNLENSSDELILDLSSFNAGIYLIEMLNDTGQRKTKELIIIK